MNELTEFFGEPISVYTAEQAIDDGILVDASFDGRFPGCLFTRGVFEAIEAVNDDRTLAQRAIPLLMDAAMIVKRKPDDRLWTDGLFGNVTGRDVWIARNELGGLTLMFPDEY